MKRNLNMGRAVRYTVCLLFIFLCSAHTSFGINAGKLKGIYTINAGSSASSTNYQSFGAAVGDLLNGNRSDGGAANGPGVDSFVIFNVADGSYNEQVTLYAVQGASAANTITFQSASADSMKVTLYCPTQSNIVYPLSLVGAKYVHFNQITLQRTGSASNNARVVRIDSGASYNSITNCRIIGLPAANTLVFTDAGPDTGNTIQNNFMKYGNYAFDWTPTTGTAVLGVKNNILDNTIDSSAAYAMFLDYQNGATISGNTITDIQGYDCIYTFGCNNLTISANTLTNEQCGDGIYTYGNNNLTITGNIISNLATSAVATGITTYSDTVVNISKNIINISYGGYPIILEFTGATSSNNSLISNNMVSASGPSACEGIYVYDATYLNILYNSVLVAGTSGDAFYIQSNIGLSSISVENNIGYNSSGGFAVNWFYTTDYKTEDYNDWFTTGANVGSWGGTSYATLANWKYYTATDSHSVSVNPQFVSSSNLNASNPLCYGAGTPVSVKDDIHGTTRNATHPCIGADEFSIPRHDAGVSAIDSPSTSYCHVGNADIYVTITNFGLDMLTSAQIGWSVNGVTQTSYYWTGSDTIGKSSVVKIGTYSFSAGYSYSVKAWTANPNGIADSNPINDTSSIQNIKQGLSGAYTIGATLPSDYTTIAAAIADITTRGLCGPVTFNIEDGSYTEQDSIPAIPGSSAINTVTFQSKSGDSTKVNWNYPSNAPKDYLIIMNGASFVTFKDITFSRTYTAGDSNSNLINFSYGECHNLSFLNNRFTGIYRSGDILLLCNVDQDSNITVAHNSFKGATYGIALLGNYTSGLLFLNNTIIDNNTLDSVAYISIYVAYALQTRITNNTITHAGVTNTPYNMGIYLYSCNGLLNVSDNRIQVLAATSGAYGIYDYYNSSTYGAPGMIYNNFISMAASAGANAVTNGILEQANAYHNIYFNNILAYGTNTAGKGIYTDANTALTIENNNISNTGGGYALYMDGDTSSLDKTDYNNLYSPGGGKVAYWYYSSDSTLASFIAASHNFNTISINPMYADSVNLDNANTALFAKGIAIPGITTDIFGKQRFHTPSIGAVEQTIDANDAGITAIDSPSGGICGGKTKVSFTLKNFGMDTLKSVIVNWQIGGVSQPVNAIVANLVYDSSVIVSYYYNFNTGGNYAIKAWTTQPNGVKDTSNKNDTSSATITIYGIPAAANAGNRNLCTGGSLSIGAAPVGTDTYSWVSIPAGYTSTSANPNVSPTVTTTYILTETNGYKCTKTDSLTVSVFSYPVAKIGPSKSICPFTSDAIGGAGIFGDSYKWTSSPASTFADSIANPLVVPTTTTTYYLTVTNTGGCSDTASLVVSLKANAVANAGSASTICAGSPATIGAASVSGSTYVWASSPSGYSSTNSSASVYPTVTTTYYLTETNSSGCSKTDTVTVTVNPLPDASFIPGTPLAGLVNFSVADSTQTGAYVWIFGDGSKNDTITVPLPSKVANTSHQYLANGTYEVKLEAANLNLCTNIDSASVTISNITGLAPVEGNIMKLQVSPNPFTANLSICYTLPQNQNVQLTLTDITGKQIATLANENQNAGPHTYTLDAAEYNIPAGIYFLHIVAGNDAVNEKIVRIR